MAQEDQNDEEGGIMQGFPKIKIEEGNASKLIDGVTDTITGIAKTGIEISRAPFTVAGRTVDGGVQGTKQGVDQGKTAPGKVGKGAMGTVGGSVQGTVKGSQRALDRLGSAVTEVGKGIDKLGNALKGIGSDIGEATGIKNKNIDSEE